MLVHPHVFYQGLSMKSQGTSRVLFGGIRFPRKRRTHHQKDGTRPPEAGSPGNISGCPWQSSQQHPQCKEENHQNWSSSKHHPPNETAPQSGTHYRAGAAVGTGKPATVSNPQSFEDTHHFPRILASWVLNYIW